MTTPVLDHPIDDIAFTVGENASSLTQLRGKWTVLFFYPRDNTPGCSAEASEFRDLQGDFDALNAQIIGVSRDTERSHARFSEKFALTFPLVADTEEELCLHFDVMKEKMMYGKMARGIERSTFIIDPDGVLRHEWRKLKAKGHAAEVLEVLTGLVAG